uniref:Uncharacterized protein n=1 Tax=Rhizophora mucronata TaxID=61149 RepID=A0A2P2JG95_RHIMU
MMTTTMIK